MTKLTHCAGLLVVVLLLGLPGCSGDPAATDEVQDDAAYFASPQEAIEEASILLREHRWPQLARYYDLTGSPHTRADLAAGPFFYSDRTDAMHHPSGVTRYRHPFAPSERLLRTEPTGEADVTKVITYIEIDQGAGPPQRGLSAFLMRKTDRGWQFLPEQVDP